MLLPREQTAIKLLYGRAFRAPNAYELYYYARHCRGTLPARPGGDSVDGDRVGGIALEARPDGRDGLCIQRRSDHRRSSVSKAARLNDIYFANVGAIHGVGIEAEVETKLPNGICRALQPDVRAGARIRSRGAPMSNSPRHLSKFGVQIPVSRLFLSVEGQYVGERLTLGGETLDGFFTPNITLTSPAERRIGFTLGVYNAFNHTYSDPGAEEHAAAVHSHRMAAPVLARVRVGF